MHLKTRVTLGLVGISAAVGAALVPATSAFAAPTMTATWANKAAGLNLQNGDTVAVTGTGFKPSTTAYLVECSGTSGQANCDLATAMPTPTDASGNFSVAAFPVHTGTVGDGSCNAASTCFIAGSTDLTGQDLSQASAAPIQFDNLQVSPRANLKNGSVLNLSGAGYKPNSTVYVSECTDTDPTKALQRCDVNSVNTYPTDANGTFTGTYNKTHTGPAVSEVGPYPCEAGKSCIVAGSDSITNPGAADAHIGGALVKFAAVTKTATKATASKAHVAKGEKFSIKGKVTAAGNAVKGLKVTLYKVKKSGLTKLGKAKTTSSKGAVKFKGLTQKKTTKYQLKTKATSAYAASVSKVVKVKTP